MSSYVARFLVNIVYADDDVELWNSADGQVYLSVKNGTDEHFEHHLLRDKKTKQWLAAKYYDETGDVIGSSILSEATNVLEGLAQRGTTHEVFIRIGGLDNAIYLDLCNKEWDAIKITSEGWDVVKNSEIPEIKFRRTNGMLPLPVPEKGGSLDGDLRPLLNAGSDNDWLLMKGWLLSLLIPTAPHPILAFRGEQDTAKSYTQKLLRAVVDPSILPIRRPAKKVEDLMIAASNNWVVSFDNMSRIGDNLSDDLCTMATGGGIAKRTQHTNAEETILEICRPITMNGIGNFITRPDLLDRSIYITLPQIPPETRSPEAKLIKEFNEKRPRILGSLLEAAVLALQKQDAIVLNDPYRMAGFVKFAAAGLGNEGDKFQAAYKYNRISAVARAIADDVLVNRLKEFVPNFCYNARILKEEEVWKGPASQLLTQLKHGVGQAAVDLLPKQPNTLSEDLTRLASALRTQGIKVEQKPRKGKANTYQWEISLLPQQDKKSGK